MSLGKTEGKSFRALPLGGFDSPAIDFLATDLTMKRILLAVAFIVAFTQPANAKIVQHEITPGKSGWDIKVEIQAGEVFPNGESLYDMIRHYAATYGSLIRTRYGEPYLTTEMMRVDDVAALEVSTF